MPTRASGVLRPAPLTWAMPPRRFRPWELDRMMKAAEFIVCCSLLSEEVGVELFFRHATSTGDLPALLIEASSRASSSLQTTDVTSAVISGLSDITILYNRKSS